MNRQIEYPKLVFSSIILMATFFIKSGITVARDYPIECLNPSGGTSMKLLMMDKVKDFYPLAGGDFNLQFKLVNTAVVDRVTISIYLGNGNSTKLIEKSGIFANYIKGVPFNLDMINVFSPFPDDDDYYGCFKSVGITLKDQRAVGDTVKFYMSIASPLGRRLDDVPVEPTKEPEPSLKNIGYNAPKTIAGIGGIASVAGIIVYLAADQRAGAYTFIAGLSTLAIAGITAIAILIIDHSREQNYTSELQRVREINESRIKEWEQRKREVEEKNEKIKRTFQIHIEKR